MTVLSMRGISKRFGATVALSGVDLDVAVGEIHALLGENGAGKSTLMKILAGAIAPDDGSIELEGTTYAPRDPIAGRNAGVAMIYQELTLAPHLTVIQNVRLGREHAMTREAALQSLSTLGLAIHPDALVRDLGPGERQLVEIARVIAANARVIVLDEPTTSIGPIEATRVFDAIRRLRELGRAVIYISHHLDEVRQIADRFTVLRDGATVTTGRVADVSDDDLITLMAGRPVGQLFPLRTGTAGEVALEVVALTGAALPRDVSLTLRRGEIVGIAGLVGAGRTEFLRTLFGLDVMRAGRVRIGVWSRAWASPNACWAHDVGMLSEDRKSEGLAQRLSIAINLLLSSLGQTARFGIVRDDALVNASAPWLARLNVRSSSPLRAINELSGGNQQKVALARLLAHDVDIFLLDEPTRGIDVGSKAEIYHLLASLAAQGKAIVMVSSVASELLGMCDRIAVMHRGTLGVARDSRSWTEDSIMRAASLGTAKEVA